MSTTSALVAGVLIGASIVLVSLLFVATTLRLLGGRATHDDALVISVRRMLYDPSVINAEHAIGGHIERIRKDMLRIDRSED